MADYNAGSVQTQKVMRFSSGFYSKEVRMTLSSFNIVFIYLYLSFLFDPSHGFEVIQPQNKTVNPDKTVFISCEHTAEAKSILDVRLNKISSTGKSMLCQSGLNDCKNIIMHQDTSSQLKYIFILLNVGPEAMNSEYECEVTVKEGDVDMTRTGTPTKLQLQDNCTVTQPYGQLAVTTPLPPPPQPHQFRWILTGLLILMFVYSCVITSFYMRLMNSSKDCDNSTYVEMRNVPLQKKPEPLYNTVQKS